jgi:hypothetical protein
MKAIVAATALALVTASHGQTSGPQDSPFAPYDLLIEADLTSIRDAAENGDITAIYAMWLATWHGLKGQRSDPNGSARWRSEANKWGEQTTHTVTRIIPGETHARVVEVPIGVTARAYDNAIRPCISHIEGYQPNSEACGSSAEDRQRREDAWPVLLTPR